MTSIVKLIKAGLLTPGASALQLVVATPAGRIGYQADLNDDGSVRKCDAQQVSNAALPPPSPSPSRLSQHEASCCVLQRLHAREGPTRLSTIGFSPEPRSMA
jgi:hypothetical protein